MAELTHLDETRDRYALERARRLRADSSHQYSYIDSTIDPWAEPIVRGALHDEVDVVVMGAGLSGLMTAVNLRKAGVERIRLIDHAGDVGGTWYWNRYPAVQCDVESYIYLPFLEDLGYMPTEKYAYGGEIFEYLQAVTRKFDLYRDALFQTEVVEYAWNDEDGRWTVLTDRGDSISAQFVVIAGGFIQRPKLPGIPGIGDFRGKIFHTSRWDYEYTGGEPGPTGGGLPNLADKVVGIIGTGATGIQAVTPVAQAAKQLYVFQRTPSAILERNNAPTDPDLAQSLQPGWQYERVQNFTRRVSGYVDQPDLVQDGWTELIGPVRASHGAGLFGGPEERHQAEEVDLALMDQVRQRVADTVESPETAAGLMPYFRFLCKRPCFHDDYLKTYNRTNVILVDTKGAGVERVTANGVVVAGKEYELDCLILATGFDAERGILRAMGIDAVGRNGVRLSDYWRKGMRTFQGVQVHNFPNLFFVGGTQTGAAPNYLHNAWELSEHVAYIINEVRQRGLSRVEASAAAEDAWVRTIKELVPLTHLEFFAACTPGYYTNEGNLDDVDRLSANVYFAGAVAFFEVLQDWRADGRLDGVQLT